MNKPENNQYNQLSDKEIADALSQIFYEGRIDPTASIQRAFKLYDESPYEVHGVDLADAIRGRREAEDAIVAAEADKGPGSPERTILANLAEEWLDWDCVVEANTSVFIDFTPWADHD